MLKVTFSKSDKFTVALLEGTIDDASDLDKLLGPIPTALRVNGAGISRMNSVGVKRWITYFQGRNRATPLEFVECSPALVQQLNSIRNFVPPNTVRSVQLPYSCPGCGHSFTVTNSCDELKRFGMVPPDVPCPKCGKISEFDDFPDEYLHFLKTG